MNLILEVCAGSITSALNASKGGAHRVELCDNLSVGGTTPSPGIIRQAVSLLNIPVFVLVRPRAGDFLYSDDEFEAMKDDILFCKDHGAEGVVLGLLKPDGTVDMERTGELIRLAHPMQVTFHRAFDMIPDAYQAMEDIIRLGINRILTSGQAASALSGADLIAELLSIADNRIIIMPGGGITEENVTTLLNITRAKEVHASLRSTVESAMQFKNVKSFMGKTGSDEYVWLESDPEKVRRLLSEINPT